MSGDPDIQFATVGREDGPTLPGDGPAPGPQERHPGRAERERTVVNLLRQLCSGLSAYRLFPGDLRQPAFVQAVQRVRDAAETSLKEGTFEAEVNGPRFITEAGPVPSDERIERLALSLYQHRVERFVLRAPPEARDLGVLYEALSKPATEDATGGVGSALRVAGVKAIAVREIAPQAVELETLQARTSPEQRELWEKLGQPDQMARELVASVANSPSLQAAAQAVFAALKQVLSTLPERVVKGFELYGRLQEVIVRLPKTLRRAVMQLMLSRIQDDVLAERVMGTMTDAQLARVLVDQGADDTEEPLVLARRLVDAGIRREDLIELTSALTMGRVEGGTIIAGLEQVGIEAPAIDASSPMAATVSSLLARGLVGAEQEDVRAIREEFPSSAARQRDVAFAALSDYLRIEADPDRLADVLTVWAEEAAAALRRRDQEHLERLLAVMDAVREDPGEPDKPALVEATLTRVLSPEMLSDLITLVDEDGSSASTIRLLAPFGEIAVDWLMDDLAEEGDRGRRGLILSILPDLARGHHRRVARRLSDARWFVARNAVTVLSRSGGPEVIPLLAEALRHREPGVRREAVRGLLAVAGMEAVPELLGLASDPDETVRATVITALGGLTAPGACAALGKLTRSLRDPADKRRGVEALTRHPSPEAVAVLAELAGTKSPPALPRRVRRFARTQLKRRQEGMR
jgi:hypothetical protein